MPSGLLNGRGCYDSIRKCEQDSNLYLSIRHHSMPFIVTEQEAKKKLDDAANLMGNHIDERIKEQFVAGALPLLRNFAKYFFLIFFFPFYFCLYQLPNLLATKIFAPLFVVAKNIYERITSPLIKAFYCVYNPIAALCCHIKQMMLNTIAVIKAPFEKIWNKVIDIKQKIHNAIILPPKKLLQKIRLTIRGSFQQVRYRWLATKVWVKLLINFGLSSVKTQNKKRK